MAGQKKEPAAGTHLDPAAERKFRPNQEDLAILARFRPMDDDFMRCMFKDNLPLVEYVLRIIIGNEKLTLIRAETQKDMKRLVGGRSLELDVYAGDIDGRKYDFEIQRSDKGAGEYRARYHSSVLDVENLSAGDNFRDLPDTVMIMLTETDFFGEGKALYPVAEVRVDSHEAPELFTGNINDRLTGKQFRDGRYILYVNGAYDNNDTELGKLMHDFRSSRADEMYHSPMAERTRQLKETEKGVEEVCRMIEERCRQERQEGRQEGIMSSVRILMEKMGFTVDAAMDFFNIPVEERERLKAGL